MDKEEVELVLTPRNSLGINSASSFPILVLKLKQMFLSCKYNFPITNLKTNQRKNVIQICLSTFSLVHDNRGAQSYLIWYHLSFKNQLPLEKSMYVNSGI